MNQYHTALEEMKKLDKYDMAIVLTELLRSGKLDFVDIASHYTKVLEDGRREDLARINIMGLHLSIASKDARHFDAKLARKKLWEFGLLKGSKFGDELDEEFKNEKQIL